jgi:hypothetical protein
MQARREAKSCYRRSPYVETVRKAQRGAIAMSTPTPDVEQAVETAIERAAAGGTHDPRIDRLYRQDVITIYTFVVVLWLCLWSVFFFVANPEITNETLRWLLIGLGVFASVFNSVGMISNTRRLKHEAVRFYSQDLFWQDEKKRRKAEGLL